MLLLWSSLALAAPNLSVAADLGSSFPTDVGARLGVEVPGRVRLEASAGILPRAYLDAINDAATANRWYQDKDAQLIDAALEDALVLRARVGWRPAAHRGFFLLAGYGWVGLGGGVTGAEVLEYKTGEDWSWLLGEDYPIEAEAALHRAELALGWEHPLGRGLFLRWDLGGSYTLAAPTRLRADFELGWPWDNEVDKAVDKAEDRLQGKLESRVHTPILGLALGFRYDLREGPVARW